SEVVEQFAELNMEFHLLPLSRSGMNPFIELRTLFAIYSLMRKIQPDIVHLVTIKPVLYGGIAARVARVPGMIAAISGLGITFSSENYQSSLLRKLINWQYMISLRHKNLKVIFQNPTDRNILLKMGAIHPEQCVIIPGSGVKISEIN
ncbi:MAG: glycosyltransferase family 1 protein, partial [Candidatus Dadabacteria bacterium]|nr:glycosyltransferase family 1 protein [Candidatus Dadabacteria bacterium]